MWGWGKKQEEYKNPELLDSISCVEEIKSKRGRTGVEKVKGEKKKGKPENQTTKGITSNDLEAPGLPLLMPPCLRIHPHVHFLILVKKEK